MMEDSDAVAVASAREGNQDAFRVLVERHSRPLFRLAFRMTGNEQDAEDIVQETFLRAYRQLDRFELRANFGTWLHRIGANCAIDLLRKHKRREEKYQRVDFAAIDAEASLASVEPAPDRAFLNAEAQQILHSALQALTPMERAAFVLRHFENQSIDEIGAALDLGQSAAKQAVFRAVQKVRRSLEPLRNHTP